jgi:molybdopterin molybdotransferase
MRIFTGAPMPDGADRVVIQEDVERAGGLITVRAENIDAGPYVRPAGADFKSGFSLAPPRRLSSSDLSLLAAMNIAQVPATRKPHIALMATGDELVMPGETPKADQIVASNIFGLKAMAEAAGARVSLLPIARDTTTSLTSAFYFAKGADLIVTIGGASDGDYDLVTKVAETIGLKQSFYKIAMRPGKPLAAGRLGSSVLLGLPGNPVSALVCGLVFLRPVIDALLGLQKAARHRQTAPLLTAVPANGPREHYMRAVQTSEGIRVFDRQDSALLTIASEANALLIRPPKDDARKAGEIVDYIPF